jgi:ABC-2 type transport system ATP-binding protein
MDEAARCSRVGFMRGGQLLIEGTPSELRRSLTDSILELRGRPLDLLRRIAEEDEDIEDTQMFGDRLHLRIQPDKKEEIVSRLQERIAASGGEIAHLNQIPPQLEDVFISLLERQQENSGNFL